jgi:hypothetical protein
MRHTADELRGSGTIREIGFFALYLVLIAMALFVGLVVWRQALFFVFYSWADFGSWARVLYMSSVVLMSLLMVAGLLVIEPYLNAAKQRGLLLTRFVKAALAIALIGVGGEIIVLLGGSR